MLNIRKLFEHADWNEAQCRKLNKQYLNYHARFLTEIVRAQSTSDEDLRRKVLFDGEEYLRAALRKGNGVILVATHMGNWYYTVFILAIYGYPVSCLHFQSPIRSFNICNEALAKRFNVDLIVVGGGAPRRLKNALENNRIIIMFFEVSVRPTRKVWLSFGNCALPIDLGSAKIALLNKAPILRIRSVALDDGRTRVTVGPEIDVPSSSGEKQAVDLMDIWLRNLSSEVLQHPEQWWPLGYIKIGSSSKAFAKTMRERPPKSIAPE